jgi:hypothetical protein
MLVVIRDILDRMRHDGCGGWVAKAEPDRAEGW